MERQAPDVSGAVAEQGEEPPRGAAALPLRSRIVAAVAVAAVAVAAVVHLGMVFLHVAPENSLSKKHDATIDRYIYPEFEQNWKLFAPDPLQQNIHVHARALVARDDGGTEITGWVDLTDLDGTAIRHNWAPSHTQQNELRRAWEFFSKYHDDDGQSIEMRGELSQEYLKRIVLHRFGPTLNGGSVERIQVRSAVTPVAAPGWSEERIETETQYSPQPWWQVTSADLPGGAGR